MAEPLAEETHRPGRSHRAAASSSGTDPRAPLPGTKPGNRRVRVDRPHSRYFRYAAPGVLSAKLATEEPAGGVDHAMWRARRVLFGRPLASEEELEQRLPKWKALPVFSSDVMSSVAYASEASLFTLAAAGSGTFGYLMPISVLIVGLLLLVTFSYRQTIRAYPNGGGSYIVAHANLGVLPGLIAAASLLTDYVLTVAVSVSSGVYNLASALPVLKGAEVGIIVGCILLVMAVNLRGMRESSTIFASPTYIFLGSMLLMIGLGVIRTALGDTPHATAVTPLIVAPESLGLLLLARAFADGCSAMTGTEAVANGVPAFKPPEWKNAQQTMLIMATLLGTMFLSMSFLAGVTGAVPAANGDSILSQVAAAVFFGRTPLYYVLIFATMGILVLAAQTSFADFPRLSSILARDGFFPRQFAFRGERLAFNAGIVVLALVSILLVIVFRGDVNALIPLYAIGVFTSFTLSQAGMVRHWLAERSPGWRRSALINGFGAMVTALVTVIFAIAKFALGAWIVLVIVPVLVALMLFVNREYRRETLELGISPSMIIGPPNRPRRVFIAALALTRAMIPAIKVARGLSSDVSVVHVAASREEGERVREQFERQVPGVDFVIVESPYRSFVRPFVKYLEVAQAEDSEPVFVVLIPEHVPAHWWDRFLYNQDANRLRAALVGHHDVDVLDVPYRAGD
jgi:amino acid transporter